MICWRPSCSSESTTSTLPMYTQRCLTEAAFSSSRFLIISHNMNELARFPGDLDLMLTTFTRCIDALVILCLFASSLTQNPLYPAASHVVLQREGGDRRVCRDCTHYVELQGDGRSATTDSPPIADPGINASRSLGNLPAGTTRRQPQPHGASRVFDDSLGVDQWCLPTSISGEYFSGTGLCTHVLCLML